MYVPSGETILAFNGHIIIFWSPLDILLDVVIIIIIYFKLQMGFYQMAVATQQDNIY
jgi:hypothetical protein